jgi:prepilin-type processing-associated H-X9-DG protein
MRKLAAVTALLTACTAGALAAPAGPAGPERAADPGPDGLLVLAALSPERAVVADPRTGATRERELAGGTLCHGPVLAAGDRVIVGGTRDGHPIALALPLSLTGRGRSLGRADGFAASTTPGRVWLSRRDALTEVGVDGRVHARTALARSRWSMLLAAVDGGFVISDEHGLAVRGRSSGRARRLPADGSQGWLVAARGANVAWCDGRCRALRVGARRIRAPARAPIEPGEAAGFSPDGRRLALPVRAPGGAIRLAVVDLDADRWRLVPGARLGDYRASAWSPSGRWLYFADEHERLRAWRDGARRPIRLPVDPRGTVMSIAVLSGP